MQRQSGQHHSCSCDVKQSGQAVRGHRLVCCRKPCPISCAKDIQENPPIRCKENPAQHHSYSCDVQQSEVTIWHASTCDSGSRVPRTHKNPHQSDAKENHPTSHPHNRAGPARGALICALEHTKQDPMCQKRMMRTAGRQDEANTEINDKL